MPDGKLQSNAGSHAPPEEVCLSDPQLPQECDGVVSHLLVGEWPINVGCVPMALHFDGEDLPFFRQIWQQFAERGAEYYFSLGW